MSNVFNGKKLINCMRQAPNLECLLSLILILNLNYIVICQECQEEYIGETGCLVKENISVYRQHIRQPQYQINVEHDLPFCSSGEFQMFPFLQTKQENKLLRKS